MLATVQPVRSAFGGLADADGVLEPAVDGAPAGWALGSPPARQRNPFPPGLATQIPGTIPF